MTNHQMNTGPATVDDADGRLRKGPHAFPPGHSEEADDVGPPPEDAGDGDDRMKKMYWRFGAMIATSTVAMFVLMYFNTYEWDHVQWSETRFYMAFVMGSTMAVIMLLFMLGMYKSKVVDASILGAAVVVFATTLWLVRSQTTVQDTSYMRAMIPHHSIAILTSERSELTDLRVLQLADEIILAQRREIAEMQWLIDDIEENGEVRTETELEARPVPEFPVTDGRDELSAGG
jgi:multisubunit Na+/H+ antiporter MnhB subunit